MKRQKQDSKYWKNYWDRMEELNEKNVIIQEVNLFERKKNNLEKGN
jgi:hypothetical protein